MLLFNIKIKSFSSTYLLHFCRKQCSYACSAHFTNQLGGGVCLSGWVVWYHFTLFIWLMWFLSHCPTHIDISKLTWILLFPSDQCAAPGILSEAWEFPCVSGVLPGASLRGAFLL